MYRGSGVIYDMVFGRLGVYLQGPDLNYTIDLHHEEKLKSHVSFGL